MAEIAEANEEQRESNRPVAHPQMGKFWSSMKETFEIATDGETTPQIVKTPVRTL